jgi:hypothetical protein
MNVEPRPLVALCEALWGIGTAHQEAVTFASGAAAFVEGMHHQTRPTPPGKLWAWPAKLR